MEENIYEEYNEEPGVKDLQAFSYKEIRNKHPELAKVSKREYMNNYSLQEELGEDVLKEPQDEYEFDDNIIIQGQDDDEDIYQEEEDYDYNVEAYAYGGDDYNQYADSRLISFEGGGTHEENSLGGIPIGYGSNGKMNTVEEGETRYNFDDTGYIFSNRIDTTGLFKDAKQIKYGSINK